jgi:hypothetical protein
MSVVARVTYDGRTRSPTIIVDDHFIFMMVDCVERYTGERPDHGEKWFPKLMAVCQLIDREIDPGTVRGALRTPPHGVSRLP